MYIADINVITYSVDN